jgi:hypothetical protein
MYLKETAWDDVAGSCEHGKGPSCSIKWGEFLTNWAAQEELSPCNLLVNIQWRLHITKLLIMLFSPFRNNNLSEPKCTLTFPRWVSDVFSPEDGGCMFLRNVCIYKPTRRNNPKDQWIKCTTSEIWGSYGDEYEDGCLLGCSIVLSGRYWPTFQRNLLPPSSGWWFIFKMHTL